MASPHEGALHQAPGVPLAGLRQPHHLVLGVQATTLADFAEVIVRTGKTLVARSQDWSVTAVTDNARVQLASSSCSCLVLITSPLASQSHPQLVDGTSHGSQSQFHLLVVGDCHLVPLIVQPAEHRLPLVQSGEDGGDLLLEVVEPGRLVQHKPPSLQLVSLDQGYLEGGGQHTGHLGLAVLVSTSLSLSLLPRQGN